MRKLVHVSLYSFILTHVPLTIVIKEMNVLLIKVSLVICCILSLQSGGLGKFSFCHNQLFYMFNLPIVLAKCNGPKVVSESYSTSEALMSAKTVFLSQYELTCDSGDDKVLRELIQYFSDLFK